MAAALPAASSMNPATISAIMAVLGPLLKGMTGNAGGAGSSFNKGQLDFMKTGLGGLSAGMGDITNDPSYMSGQSWLTGLFSDPEFFKNFEAPLQRQFQEETVGNLANRFAGMGSGGSHGSTGFRNALGREGSKLHEMIASLRGGMQQSGVNQALQYGQAPVSNYLSQLQQFLTPTENTYQSSSF